MSFRPFDAQAEHARLLIITERLHDAIVARDEVLVRRILDSTVASTIPRPVREEALAIAVLPHSSMRAPMQLLQFHHRLAQMLESDDDEAAGQIEMRLDRRRAG